MSKRGRRSQHRKENKDSTLFISIRGQKLPDYITGQHLKQHFQQFEHVIVNSKVQREKDTMKSKGYAFINFTSSSAANEAMRTLQGSLLRGKFPLKIKKYARKGSAKGAACLPDSDTESISDSDSDSTNTTLYVGVFDSKFPNYINSSHLRNHFSEFEHTIENAMIVRDMQTKQTKGYGFVTFTSHAAAEVAMKKLRGSKLHGKFKLFINFKGRRGSTSTTLSPSSSTAPSLSPSLASSTIDLSCFSEDETEQSESDCKLYVSVNKSKFPNYINSRHLEAHFFEFKEHIKKALIVRDFRTKRTKGYGFVTFKSRAAAETAMKKLRGSKLDGKFSLFISVKKDDMEQQSSPIEDEKVLEPLSRSAEELLYLRYRFYISPTVASWTVKNSLPAELMLRENVLYLHGTRTAVSSSTSQLGTSTLLHNLQTLAFHGTWNPSFIIQLKESILPGINQSDKDVMCILSSQHEQGPNSTSFTVQIYSHNYKILQEAYQELNELKPQSKLFQMRPEYQTVSGLTDAFLSFGRNHHTRIEKESGQGVRIYGLKSEDIQTCWMALKTFVDSNIVVTVNVSVGFWEAKYLRTKCGTFICTLESEGCKVQLPTLSATQQQGKVKLVLTGKLKATKQAGEKITTRCSQIIVQPVNLSCSTKYLSIWIQRWKEFIEEQSKKNSSVLIEYEQKRQPGTSQSQAIAFTVMGTDSAAVTKAKNDLIQQENGSKEKLAIRDLVITSEEFVVLSNNLKECEAKLKQSHNILITVELDFSKKYAQLVTAPNKKSIHDTLQADVKSFIASKTPAAPKHVTKEIKFKDEVFGALLTSRTKHLSMVEQKGDVLSVDVQPDQSQPSEYILRLTGSGVNVRAVELTIESIITRLETTVAHAQLVVGGHNISITSTDSFKSFCSQLLKELHVHCMYHPPVGGDLLRQVHLKSKAGHIITLQIAIGQLSKERVDAIVVPADSCDTTMTNVEMRFEYFKCSETKSLAVGEIACIDSGSFPSRKALHVALPKRHGLAEKEASDFVALCVNALDYATNNHFGSLSFPALGVDSVHNVSGSVAANTLLLCIDKYYCQKKDATLHTIRIVITQDLSSTFLSCFDEHSFEASVHQSEPSPSSTAGINASSPPKYEWYWEDDKKQFTQYSKTVSDALTAAKLENPDKRCYIRIDGKTYLVDLSTMIQKNVSSGYIRKVMCKEVSSISSAKTSLAKVQWYYRDDKKNLAAYSQADSAKIENMYQKVSGARTYLQIQGQIYTFDFEDMKQVNISTKYRRDIKREETPIKETKEVEPKAEESSQCVINLRGPQENLETAKQKVKDKLESLSAFKNVPLPPASTPALKHKLFSIARRHSVSSFIREDEKPKLSGTSNRRFSQVIRIEGAEHLVDKAVTEVQGEIIEFQSLSSSSSAAQADIQYPTEWEVQTSTTQLFKLDEYSQEQIRVLSMFKETMPNASIISVQRIQNKWLWERYSQHKERIREKNDGAVNEKELWHGSIKSSSDNIYNSEEGFDMRFSSKGLWGLANYFAEKASYSDKYAFTFPGGTKELLLAKVVTGDSFECVSDPSLRMPPEKPKNKKTGSVQLKQLRYDSVTGMTSNCRVYMTYSNDKAYPAYLISYSTTPKPSYRVPPPLTQSQTFLARLQAKFGGFTQ